MPEVTEEGKEAVLSTSPIKNIKFYANDEFGTSIAETDNNDIENYDDVNLTKDSRSISVKAGQYLKRNPTNDYWSSVGYRAQIGTQKGFITCAHGWNKNASAYLSNGTKLGKITKIAKNSTTDAAFIASDFGWYGLQDGIKARGSGNAAEGNTVIFDGARHYQNGRGREKAEVVALNGHGTTDEGISFNSAIVFNKPSLHGDSGAAVLVDMYDDGSKYKLVGFVRTMYRNTYDGRYTWGTACQWKYVKNALGCRISN